MPTHAGGGTAGGIHNGVYINAGGYGGGKSIWYHDGYTHLHTFSPHSSNNGSNSTALSTSGNVFYGANMLGGAGGNGVYSGTGSGGSGGYGGSGYFGGGGGGGGGTSNDWRGGGGGGGAGSHFYIKGTGNDYLRSAYNDVFSGSTVEAGGFSIPSYRFGVKINGTYFETNTLQQTISLNTASSHSGWTTGGSTQST